MKHTTCSILFSLVALATPVIYGDPPAPGGVTGVDVVVKERPRDHAVTDVRGNFAIEALAGGSYTLVFRARKAAALPETTRSEIIVALTYSIKIEGTKRSVNQRGLSSDKLIAGVEIPVEVGPGARIRGQVLPGAVKRMVWISPEVGSHMAGHWVEGDSREAIRAHNVAKVSKDDLQNHLQR